MTARYWWYCVGKKKWWYCVGRGFCRSQLCLLLPSRHLSQFSEAVIFQLPPNPPTCKERVAKKGRKLNNKSRLSGFAVVNYHLQSGEKKRLIGVCVICLSQPCLVQQVVWPGTPCTPGLRGRGRTWRSRERSWSPSRLPPPCSWATEAVAGLERGLDCPPDHASAFHKSEISGFFLSRSAQKDN